MRRYAAVLSVLAAVAAASCSSSLRSIRLANEQAPAGGGSSGPTEPEEWFLSQRVYRQGIPAGALARAWNQAAAIDILTAAHGALLGGAWSFAGPTNIGGRVLDIAERGGGAVGAAAENVHVTAVDRGCQCESVGAEGGGEIPGA